MAVLAFVVWSKAVDNQPTVAASRGRQIQIHVKSYYRYLCWHCHTCDLYVIYNNYTEHTLYLEQKGQSSGWGPWPPFLRSIAVGHSLWQMCECCQYTKLRNQFCVIHLVIRTAVLNVEKMQQKVATDSKYTKKCNNTKTQTISNDACKLIVSFSKDFYAVASRRIFHSF